MTSKKKQRNHKVKDNDNATTKASTAKQPPTATATAGPQPAQQPALQKGIFSPGQLAALILLTLGVSRLMQVKSALRSHASGGVLGHISSSSTVESDINNDNTTASSSVEMKPAPICLDYILNLPEIVCVHDVVNTWLNFKYMTGLQVLLTTLGMWIRGGCWNNENVLRGFNALLILTPIVTTAYALLIKSEGVLNQSRIWQQTIMCVVLSFVASPLQSQLPFINRTLGQATSSTKRTSYKTVSSLMLMTLFWMQMLQVLDGIGLVNPRRHDESSTSTSSNGGSSWFPQLPSKTVMDTSSDEEKAVAGAIWTIHSFWLVDMFTLAAIYFFAWFHLSSEDQKVSACMYICIYLCTYIYTTAVLVCNMSRRDAFLLEVLGPVNIHEQ